MLYFFQLKQKGVIQMRIKDFQNVLNLRWRILCVQGENILTQLNQCNQWFSIEDFLLDDVYQYTIQQELNRFGIRLNDENLCYLSNAIYDEFLNKIWLEIVRHSRRRGIHIVFSDDKNFLKFLPEQIEIVKDVYQIEDISKSKTYVEWYKNDTETLISQHLQKQFELLKIPFSFAKGIWFDGVLTELEEEELNASFENTPISAPRPITDFLSVSQEDIEVLKKFIRYFKTKMNGLPSVFANYVYQYLLDHDLSEFELEEE